MNLDNFLSFLNGGLLDLRWWGVALCIFWLTHITIASVTIFLHRHQAHRALELSSLPSHFFRLWLWLTTGMETKAWTAIHRKHHAKCETKEDPHSPQVLGIWKVLLEGSELYRKEAKNSETIEQYGNGTPDDWLEKNLYAGRSRLGIVLMLAIDVLLFGAIGIFVWAVQMIWIPLFAAGIINGLGHYFGYRNWETGEASTNIVPWGILIGGEELHNNHHAFASSAKLSQKSWEFDIGWFYIRCLEELGLAKVKRTASEADVLKESVLSNYTNEVLLPLSKAEKWKVPKTYRATIRRFISGRFLKSEEEKTKAKRMVERCYGEELKSAFKLKEELRELLSKKEKDFHLSLERWKSSAMEAKINLTENFLSYLSRYAESI